MKVKSVMAVLTAVSMLAAVLTGCSDGGAASTSKDTETNQEDAGRKEQEEVKSEVQQSKYQTTYGSKQFDNVTITVELFDRSNAPEGSSITDNRWVDYVNEQMNKVGITVEFVTVPRWDEVTKMQTMMSSGTSPDLTLTYTYAYAKEYYDQGGIWDLSEFVDGEDQAQNLKKYLGDNVMDIGRTVDGELYGIVAKRATTAHSNLFIRKDWLDDLGLEIPTTPDELYDVVEQMVKNNPDGKDNVIGMSFNSLTSGSGGWRNTLALAFSQLAGDPKEIDIAHGIDYYYDPGSREYFRYINKCYNTGLMDAEYYAGSTDTYNSDIVNGNLAFFENMVNYSVDVLRGSLLYTLQQNDPEADIISIPPLANVNDGKQYCNTYAAGGLIAFCPKTADAKKVEACMTYLDWQSTNEGGFVLYHGFEGEHFEYDENKVPVVIDAAYNSTDKDWLRTDIFLVGNQGYFETVDDFNLCSSKEAPGFEQYVIDNYENSLYGNLIPMTTYVSPTQQEITTDLSLLCDEYVVKVVTAPEGEFDALFDEFLQACDDLGMKKVVEERTAYFSEIYD